MEGENAIMNFELKQFGIPGAASLAGDALVVLVPKNFVVRPDELRHFDQHH